MELSGMTIVIMLTKFPPILTFKKRCRALLRNGVEHYLVFGLASPPGRDHPSYSPLPWPTSPIRQEVFQLVLVGMSFQKPNTILLTDLSKDPPICWQGFSKTRKLVWRFSKIHDKIVWHSSVGRYSKKHTNSLVDNPKDPLILRQVFPSFAKSLAGLLNEVFW